MTRKEFSDRYDAFVRDGSRHMIWIIGPMIGIITAAPLVSDFLQRRYGASLANAIVLTVLLASMGWFVGGLILLNRRFVRRFGLLCPSCGQQLTDKMTHRKLLVTGHCSKCRAEVFDRQEASRAAPVGRLNRDDLKSELETLEKQSKRASTRALILLFSAMTACAIFGAYLERFVDEGRLDWITVTEIKWCAGLMLATLFIFVFGGLVFAIRGKFNVGRTPCPECGRSLSGWPARGTIEGGMCIYCGCQLFNGTSNQRERVGV